MRVEAQNDGRHAAAWDRQREGADVVTASEARKVARRIMCDVNEIDRLSEQDSTAARRADA